MIKLFSLIHNYYFFLNHLSIAKVVFRFCFIYL